MTDDSGAAPAAGRPVDPQAPHILLVEDNPVNSRSRGRHARDPGLPVEAADNGWLAVEAMNDTTYDAVLMDCQMPVMDGLTRDGGDPPARAAARASRACPSLR